MTDAPEQRASLDAFLHRGAEEMRARADRIDPWSGPEPETVAIATEIAETHESVCGACGAPWPNLDCGHAKNARYSRESYPCYPQTDEALAIRIAHAITAAQQQARKAALEEAAKIADSFLEGCTGRGAACAATRITARGIGSDIRALMLAAAAAGSHSDHSPGR